MGEANITKTCYQFCKRVYGGFGVMMQGAEETHAMTRYGSSTKAGLTGAYTGPANSAHLTNVDHMRSPFAQETSADRSALSMHGMIHIWMRLCGGTNRAFGAVCDCLSDGVVMRRSLKGQLSLTGPRLAGMCWGGVVTGK